MKFRKRPVEIEAVQFFGLDEDNVPRFFADSFGPGDSSEGPDWLTEALAIGTESAADMMGNIKGGIWVTAAYGPEPALMIGTLEGRHVASPGDWIARGVKGEIYPIKPGIFDLTYDAV